MSAVSKEIGGAKALKINSLHFENKFGIVSRYMSNSSPSLSLYHVISTYLPNTVPFPEALKETT